MAPNNLLSLVGSQFSLPPYTQGEREHLERGGFEPKSRTSTQATALTLAPRA